MNIQVFFVLQLDFYDSIPIITFQIVAGVGTELRASYVLSIFYVIVHLLL